MTVMSFLYKTHVHATFSLINWISAAIMCIGIYTTYIAAEFSDGEKQPPWLIRTRRCFWHATRLCSAIRRHHPSQRAVLSQICCFGERKVVVFQILLDRAEPRDARTTQLSSPVRRRGRLTGSSWHLCCHHAHNMPKQGKSARQDYSSEFGLLR